MDKSESATGGRDPRLAFDEGYGTAADPDPGAGKPGVPLGEWPRSAPVRFGLRLVDAHHRGRSHCAEVRRDPRGHGGRRTAGEAGVDPAEAVAASLSARSGGDRALAAGDLPRHSPASETAGWGGVLLGRVGVPGRYTTGVSPRTVRPLR